MKTYPRAAPCARQRPADEPAPSANRRSGSASFTRSWNRAESYARGSTWSDAESTQRVYEYAVEPRVLQDLPDSR